MRHSLPSIRTGTALIIVAVLGVPAAGAGLAIADRELRGPAPSAHEAPGPRDHDHPAGFTISGNASATLLPGAAARPILARLANPNAVPIFVTTLTASLEPTKLPAGCRPADFQITPSSVSSAHPVQVPARGAVTLPAQGASAPTIRMLDTSANQNACANATLRLGYTGSAHS